MSDAGHAPDGIEVAQNDGTAFVRVTGSGSFKVSTALRQFGASVLDQGCKHMVVDLAMCIGMDSTFMGVLAGLAMRITRQGGGRMLLAGICPEVAARLSALGIDRVMDVQGRSAMDDMTLRGEAVPGLRGLDTSAAASDRRLNVETSLAAHEDLAGLCPENGLKFKDVLEFLKEDLKRHSGGEADRQGSGQ
jgi:anti-anti-sigma factor